MKLRCQGLERPKQHLTRRGFKTKVDCYLTRLTKFPVEVAVAHSRYEMLLWGIMEGDPEVRLIIPQSHRFYIGSHTYTSDLYIEKNGKRIIAEVKSENKFSEFEATFEALKLFLKPTPYEFVYITNESIREREIFARNWLFISRSILTSSYVETKRAKQDILDRLSLSPSTVGEIISLTNRVDDCQPEVALFRLAYIGKINLDLEHDYLTSDTRVSLCH